MPATLDACLRSWPFEPWLLLALLLPAGVYLRGWLLLHRRDARRWHGGLLAAFLGGLTVLFLALASPIETFAGLLLQVHMVQHVLLMMAVPPLLWLGCPLFPLLRGLPAPIRTCWVAPLLRSPRLRRLGARWTHPLHALPLYVVATWLWHVPAVYEVALRSRGWHDLQHACFLGAALLFWYPVVRPYPGRPLWSPWLLFPYLILADVQNTVLSALLTFADRVLYPYYTQVPRLGGLSALEDQAAAGVIMWVPGSLIFLLPLFAIGIRLLDGGAAAPSNEISKALARARPKDVPHRAVAGALANDLLPIGMVGEERTGRDLPVASLANDLRSNAMAGAMRSRSGAASPHGVIAPDRARIPAPMARPASCRQPLPVVNSRPDRAPTAVVDLLRLPLLGRFLRWRHARLAMQVPLLGLAGLLILDGLRGPQVGALNLAGVLPWIHWRGLVILALLAAGNLFCMACPFMLPRNLARRWLPEGWPWPRWLRTKWLAVLLLIVFLWAYEACALWNSPWWTAWIALAYFTVPLVVDGFFRGASFCKYLCPIGQFNFVQSLVSPLAVQVRDPAICSTCRTKDCIRGRPAFSSCEATGQAQALAGCELNLFQPRKAGNMDCTFCLDCVHACPHDNIGLPAGLPGRGLWQDDFRSGIGRFSKRPDLAALVLVLVFGAFANAAGMVGPVVEGQDRLRTLLGQRSPLLVVTLFYLLSLLGVPLLAVGGAALLSRWWGRLPGSWLDVATRHAYALVPLGFGMWLAHYSFHFLTSYDTVIPTAQRFAGELGWLALGEPHWTGACCRRVAGWLPRLEIVFLDLGLLLSLYTGYRIAQTDASRPVRALQAFSPWALLIVLLFGAGIWIVFQPMQMRGTF